MRFHPFVSRRFVIYLNKKKQLHFLLYNKLYNFFKLKNIFITEFGRGLGFIFWEGGVADFKVEVERKIDSDFWKSEGLIKKTKE